MRVSIWRIGFSFVSIGWTPLSRLFVDNFCSYTNMYL